MSAEFEPLRVRRYEVPAQSSEQPPAAAIEESAQFGQLEDPDATPLPDDAHSSVDGPSPASAEPHRRDDPAPCESSFDTERFEAAVREEAIRFASIAAARALRVALADRSTIAKYVDDALRACGRAGQATVRLCPRDALAYRSTRDVDVVSDDACEPGQVVIEHPTGSLGATVDDRAALLVRAAAC